MVDFGEKRLSGPPLFNRKCVNSVIARVRSSPESFWPKYRLIVSKTDEGSFESGPHLSGRKLSATQWISYVCLPRRALNIASNSSHGTSGYSLVALISARLA